MQNVINADATEQFCVCSKIFDCCFLLLLLLLMISEILC